MGRTGGKVVRTCGVVGRGMSRGRERRTAAVATTTTTATCPLRGRLDRGVRRAAAYRK